MSGIVEQPSQDAASAAALYGEIAEGWSLSDLDEDRPQKPARPAKAGEIVDGQIKWFDATRGFGFIVRDDGQDDVLLKVAAVRGAGYAAIWENSLIRCRVQYRPAGAIAVGVISLDASTAIDPSRVPPLVRPGILPDAPWSDWKSASIVRFHWNRGLTLALFCDDRRHVLCPISILRHFGIVEHRTGAVLDVRWGIGSRGATVAEIKPPIRNGFPSLGIMSHGACLLSNPV